MKPSLRVVHEEWRGALVRGLVEHAAEEGNRKFAEVVLEDAQRHVPLDLGTLQDSAEITQDRGVTGRFGSEHYISYDTPYAIRLHEHPEYNFQGQGEGKWLEHAVQRHTGRVKEYVAPFLRVFGRP